MELRTESQLAVFRYAFDRLIPQAPRITLTGMNIRDFLREYASTRSIC